MKTTLFDFLNDISHLKKNILSEENESDYSPYMINRFLSMDPTTVLYANEMNAHYELPKRMHFDYCFHSLKKQRRFFKYIKHKNEDVIAVIREYYGYSERLAKQIVPIFTDEDIEYMRCKLNKGGASNAEKKRR